MLVHAQSVSRMTRFEASGGMETPRYAETMEFCRMLDKSSSEITLVSFGKSAKGLDLPLLIVDGKGLTSPDAIRKSGKIVVLVQACIHPGECEGKDALLMLLRDMILPGESHFFREENNAKDFHHLLDHVSLLIIPIFNVDGHERFGPYNRANQDGPKEMGWRVNANNRNLNRDYIKADTPEMRAWLALFDKWMPDFFIDTHTTDGADYQYALTYMMETWGTMDPNLTDWSKSVFIPAMEKQMADDQFKIFPYITFRNWTELKSGLEIETSPPMLSQAYTSFRNRPGLLIETHMLKPYKQRVEATFACLISSLNILNRESEKLHALVKEADGYCSSAAFRQKELPLQYKVLYTDSVMTDFLGVGYETVKSPVTGVTYNRYLKNPVTYRLPVFSHNVPAFSVKLPEYYVVPAEWGNVIDLLKLHGARMTVLKNDTTISIVTYKFKNPKWQATPYEGHHVMTNIEYDLIQETRQFAAGSVLVPAAQPSGRIIAHLLEPKGEGSLVYWGFFDAIFEQKEYIEQYVIEPMILKMLDTDPALKTEFETKMKSDSVFAKNPGQVERWFFMKTPYFDQRKDIYPIGKIL
jgi:hypothetical protein